MGLLLYLVPKLIVLNVARPKPEYGCLLRSVPNVSTHGGSDGTTREHPRLSY